MISGFGRRIRWNSEPPEVTVTVNSPSPPVHPEQRLLDALGIESFERLEADTVLRVSRGVYVGRLDSNFRRRTYTTTMSAAVDEKLWLLEDAVEDHERAVQRIRRGAFSESEFGAAQALLDRARDRLAQAKRYEPLGARWALLRGLRDLADAPVPHRAPRVTEPAARAERAVASVMTVAGHDANLGHLREAQREAEVRHRDSMIEKFDQRQMLKAGRPAPDPDDVVIARVQLETKLVDWNESNPGLVAELEAFARAQDCDGD